jgi:hypothetical protein
MQMAEVLPEKRPWGWKKRFATLNEEQIRKNVCTKTDAKFTQTATLSCVCFLLDKTKSDNEHSRCCL